MDLVQRLEAIEEIKQLKARYFRCLDTKDWEAFADVFTPDARMDMSGEVRGGSDEGVTTGSRAIAAFVRRMVGDVTTVHHGHTPEIEVTSPSTATGVWAMEDKLRWPDGAPLAAMHGYGHYHDRYEMADGGWRIKSTTLTRLRVDFEPGAATGS